MKRQEATLDSLTTRCKAVIPKVLTYQIVLRDWAATPSML
jgi:hypothetical protein